MDQSMDDDLYESPQFQSFLLERRNRELAKPMTSESRNGSHRSLVALEEA